MSSIPAHPILAPISKHDLFGPWPLPSSSKILSDESPCSSSCPFLNKSSSIIEALCSSSSHEGYDRPLSSIYTYPDGPNNPPLGRSLIVCGFADKEQSMVRKAIESVEQQPHQPQYGFEKCTVGVHRCDGEYARKIPREKLKNSNQFASLLACLYKANGVAVVKLDNVGRVGFICPMHVLPDGVNGIDVGKRGSYAGCCYFSDLEIVKEKLSGNDDDDAADVDDDEGGMQYTPTSPQYQPTSPQYRPPGEEDGNNDVPMWQPDADDNNNNNANNNNDDNNGNNDNNDDAPMWQPDADDNNDDNNDAPMWQPDDTNDDNDTNDAPLWQPDNNDDDNDNTNDASSLWQPPGDDENNNEDETNTNDFFPGDKRPHDETYQVMDTTINSNNNNNNNDEDDEEGEDKFHKNKGAADADKFYSGLTRTLGTRADSRLYHMRAFNGWVKAVQISELNPITGDHYNNNTNTIKQRGVRLPPIRVLDLACGKGGDLGKWILQSRGIQNYVGIDVARGSLRDAAIRASRLLGKLKKCMFICADLGHDVPGSTSKKHTLLSWTLTQETSRMAEPTFDNIVGGGVHPTDRFDVVSVQFAIHYMMQTRERARRFFKTVSDLLDLGGNLVATTIDARVIVNHIMNLGLDFEDLKRDRDQKVVVLVGGCCKFTFDAETVLRLFHRIPPTTNEDQQFIGTPLHKDIFGLQYTFTLSEGEDHSAGVGEAVDLPEWLTPIPMLEALAKEAGLEITSVENFHEFYSNRQNASDHPAAHVAMYNMHVLNMNGSISKDEWEVSRLYMAIKFTKIGQSTVDIVDSDYEDMEEDHASQPTQPTPVPAPVVKKPSAAMTAANAKKIPIAMMKAKRLYGDQWNTLSQEEKQAAMQQQLANI